MLSLNLIFSVAIGILVALIIFAIIKKLFKFFFIILVVLASLGFAWYVIIKLGIEFSLT
ncbi:MAG: hypothetical protein V1898_03905 [Patescibacteria group bacterium]